MNRREGVGSRMKKLMILGAGISQVPLIQKAKEMGLYTIVVSWKGNYPGLLLADRAYYEDTTNVERVVEIAKLEQIDGICTTGTDVAIKSLGKVVSALNLTGICEESASNCSDKLLMKKMLLAHEIKTANYQEVRNKQDSIHAFRQLKPPVMFKAVDCGASKGIIRVEHEDQIDYAYSEVMKWTKQDYFIVEQFIAGQEFGAQAFIFNKQIQFVLPHGDMMFQGDTGVPIGHYVPYELPDDVIKCIEETVHRSAEALQLDNCAINADFIWRDNEIYVLEIGARAGATCLPELVSTYYGFNYYEQLIRAAVGETPNFSAVQFHPCACELLLSNNSGLIATIENHNQENPDVLDISFDYQPGDAICKFKIGTDRIGQIIVKGKSAEEALYTLEELKKNIRIELT